MVATVTLDDSDPVARTTNEKLLHKFIYGPGECSKGANTPFPCPAGGKTGFEVAAAVKAPTIGGGMNIRGQSELRIEIIGLKSKWD